MIPHNYKGHRVSTSAYTYFLHISVWTSEYSIEKFNIILFFHIQMYSVCLKGKQMQSNLANYKYMEIKKTKLVILYLAVRLKNFSLSQFKMRLVFD